MSTLLMGLNTSTPGVTSGLGAATNIESNWPTIDSHNHSGGQGALVISAGININADLPFSGNRASTLLSTQYNSQGAVLTGIANDRSVYVVGSELYFRDGSGNNVQITSAGFVSNSSGVFTFNRALVSNGAGAIITSAATATEVGFLAGLTSAAQGQISARELTAKNVQNVASADFTAVSTTQAYFFTTGAANRNLNLPAAAASTGIRFFCQKVDTGVGFVYVDPSGAELINGFSRVALHLANEGITFISDGSAWRIVGYNSSNYAAWTSTFTAASPMTYTGVTTSMSQWRKISIDAVEMRLIASGTTGGTAAISVRFSPPLNAQTDEFTPGSTCSASVFISDGGSRAGITQWGTATSLAVFRFDTANWGLGGGRQFNISGTYRIDPAA